MCISGPAAPCGYRLNDFRLFQNPALPQLEAMQTRIKLCRNRDQRCLFSGDTVLLSPTEQWCFSMQDTGGFHIFSLLQVNGTELDISVGFSQ